MKIVTLTLFGVALATLACLSCETFLRTYELQSIQGTFDVDSQEWKIQNLPNEKYVSRPDDLSNQYDPVHSKTGGNPGGFLYHIDRNYGVWYFAASDAFVEKTKDGYGQTLTFDLRQLATDQQVETDDIVLVSGNIKLVYNAPYNPGVDWTNYAVHLDTTALWRTWFNPL